jgi:hypothetical protein
MNKKPCFIALFCLIFAVSGSLYAVGEKTIRLGGNSIWEMANYKAGITEVNLVRPTPVLVLSSVPVPSSAPSLDLAISFDEGRPALFRDSTGHYRVAVSPFLAVVDEHYARTGSGAALFPEDVPADGKRTETAESGAPLVIKVQKSAALFAPNNRIYDFSIEFWVHPLNMENGEQILQWISASPIKKAGSNYASQRVMCVSSKNRLQWSFINFFASPDGTDSVNIDIGGYAAVVPKTWSHHLIRFDSINGMVEYLVNGKTESIEYATSTGREGGEVYTPIAGEGGSFILGSGFSGLIDEFKIHHNHPGPAVRKYPAQGGRIETRALDLGEGSNGILKVEASGGKVSVRDAKINGEFRRNGRFRFSDDSEMQFFIRSSDNPYRWDNSWRPVTPGADLNGVVHRRYVQLAVDFYPSANGETSPYLEELCLTYLPDEPPLPPAQLTAIAMDGAVQLRWKNSPDQNTQGYLVYYGTSSDDYFGEDSSLGGSPIDAGKQNTIYINGLKNGTLYYFRIAAYSSPFHIGEFSREVRARPLR